MGLYFLLYFFDHRCSSRRIIFVGEVHDLLFVVVVSVDHVFHLVDQLI
jgi:hypothetical protein